MSDTSPHAEKAPYVPASNENLAGWATAWAGVWTFFGAGPLATELGYDPMLEGNLLLVGAVMFILLVLPLFAALKVSSLTFSNAYIRFCSEIVLSLVFSALFLALALGVML